MLIIILTAVLLFGYGLLIYFYKKAFERLKPFTPDNFVVASTFFSVIIPARDEEDVISACVTSILKNKYPKHLYEVIVVNDNSADSTAAIIKSLQAQHANVKLIELGKLLKGKLNSYKKKAIEVAVEQSKGEWIITTDADCIVTEDWFSNYDTFIQKQQPIFIAAPVMLINTGSFVCIFQCLDFISLQGITAASVSAGFHSMCNGANLAYKKQAFYEVNGFKDIDNIASGDDMLLMQKIQQNYPKKTGYLFSKESIVRTLPMPGWLSFFNQRIRWASKAGSYKEKKIFFVLLLVYILNLLLFILPFTAFWYKPVIIYWLVLIAVKTVSELPFMYAVAKFYNMQQLLWWFAVMQPFHITYTVIAGWLGKFGKYTWKGRTVK